MVPEHLTNDAAFIERRNKTTEPISNFAYSYVTHNFYISKMCYPIPDMLNSLNIKTVGEVVLILLITSFFTHTMPNSLTKQRITELCVCKCVKWCVKQCTLLAYEDQIMFDSRLEVVNIVAKSFIHNMNDSGKLAVRVELITYRRNMK